MRAEGLQLQKQIRHKNAKAVLQYFFITSAINQKAKSDISTASRQIKLRQK